MAQQAFEKELVCRWLAEHSSSHTLSGKRQYSVCGGGHTMENFCFLIVVFLKVWFMGFLLHGTSKTAWAVVSLERRRLTAL